MSRVNDCIVVFITTSSTDEANLIASELISKKAAACVNVIPINSIFSWKGKVEKAKEILLTVKTRNKLFKKLEFIVRKCHSYEVPEIIALPIVAGSRDYLDWIRESTK